jgi:hypothetical protein
LTTIVQTMYAAGSQVAIGNLLDVLTTPLFVSVPNLPVAHGDPIMVDLGILSGGLIPDNAGTETLASNVITSNSLTAGSYLTFAAMPAVAAYVGSGGAGAVPTGLVAANQALPAAFAAQVQAQNNAYNAAIAAVASSTGAALVDIHGGFPTVVANAAAVNPGICCFLVPFGGLTSNDMLHPSVTGYAFIANAWIAAINAKFGTSIPAVNIATAYNQDPYAPGSAVFGAAHMRGGAR